MKPYKSGKYIVTDRCLITIASGRVDFFCECHKELYREQFPPDAVQPSYLGWVQDTSVEACPEEEFLRTVNNLVDDLINRQYNAEWWNSEETQTEVPEPPQYQDDPWGPSGYLGVA